MLGEADEINLVLCKLNVELNAVNIAVKFVQVPIVFWETFGSGIRSLCDAEKKLVTQAAIDTAKFWRCIGTDSNVNMGGGRDYTNGWTDSVTGWIGRFHLEGEVDCSLVGYP